MKSALFLFFLVAISCVSCGKKRIYGNNFEGIILEGDFVPNEEDINSFESGFGKYIQSLPVKDSGYYLCGGEEEINLILSNLSKYKRKYSGRKESGQKILIVDAILPECTHGQDWENSEIKDGGDCVIHIRYNLSTRQYSGFQDNGSG